MRTLMIVVFIFAAANLVAQTRRIAHRAHGGKQYHASYTSSDNYGNPRPSKVHVHLESGRDTVVSPWDSLARPYYLDTLPNGRIQFLPLQNVKDIHEMGKITGRLIV